MASKTQDKIRLLWITSTHDTSPARPTLPSLDLKDKSNPTFRRLQRLIRNFNQSLDSWISTNLKFEYSGTFKLNIATTIIKHERKCLAHFLEEWEDLEPCLQHSLFVKFTWSKEVYDLLELVVDTLHQLQNQVDEIHHSVYGFLEPQRTSRIHPMQSVSAATSASNGLERYETPLNLRRRSRRSAQSSLKTSGPREGGLSLDERTTMR
jgi:hypothetical protein